MLKNKAGIDLVHVPYKGISLAVPAVMAGEVQLTFAGIATSMPQLKAGRIKAIAIGGAAALAAAAGGADLRRAGLSRRSRRTPGSACSCRPARRGRRCHESIAIRRRILDEPEFRQKQLIDKGYEVVGSSPDEFAAYIQQGQREPRPRGEDLGREGGVAWKRSSSGPRRASPSRSPAKATLVLFLHGIRGNRRNWTPPGRVLLAPLQGRGLGRARLRRLRRLRRRAAVRRTSPATCCASPTISRRRQAAPGRACRWAGASRATSRCAIPERAALAGAGQHQSRLRRAAPASDVRRFVAERRTAHAGDACAGCSAAARSPAPTRSCSTACSACTRRRTRRRWKPRWRRTAPRRSSRSACRRW